MRLVVNDQVHLSGFRSSDKPALIQHLNDRDIYDRTLRIPFPYTDAAADEWLALVAKITEQQGRPVQFAIRSADDALMGGCGFDGCQVGKSHRAEVGYWLANLVQKTIQFGAAVHEDRVQVEVGVAAFRFERPLEAFRNDQVARKDFLGVLRQVCYLAPPVARSD